MIVRSTHLIIKSYYIFMISLASKQISKEEAALANLFTDS